MRSANAILAGSTLVAALFVAVQAWYARVEFYEMSANRLLESKLAICFENYDAAARLDAGLQKISGDPEHPDQWPPRVVLRDAAQMSLVQKEVVPLLDSFEGSLVKASILDTLEKERSYLSQHVAGLGERIRNIAPDSMQDAAMNQEIEAIDASLSELLGAQYLVIAGCRSVTERKA